MSTQEFDYDLFMTEIEKCRDSIKEPCWIITRSMEDAQAFADWCVENGFKEPRIELIDKFCGILE